ncbi:MAG: DUF7555 family protein [Methanobacteriota archaeon]
MGAARDRLATLARAWADAVAYVVFLSVLVTGAAVAVGIATGGGFVRGKALLFVGGWLLIGYGTVRLWPSSVEDLSGPVISTRGTRLEGIVRRLPPLCWIRLPAPTDRVRVASKVFLAGVVVLGASLLMETWLGVR